VSVSEYYRKARTDYTILLFNRPNQSNINREDMKFLDGFCSDAAKLELPLRLAMFVSPLFLLIPKSLHKSKRRIDALEVTQVCSSTRLTTLNMDLSLEIDRQKLGEQ
jgi:hypothetical protein